MGYGVPSALAAVRVAHGVTARLDPADACVGASDAVAQFELDGKQPGAQLLAHRHAVLRQDGLDPRGRIAVQALDAAAPDLLVGRAHVQHAAGVRVAQEESGCVN